MAEHTARGIRLVRFGLVVNAALALTKFVAGVVGSSYALIADAVESSFDIFASLVVWGGLRIAAQPADANHPYGHGKAEPLAAAVVSLMLLGAAVGIAVEAVREILTPHRAPAPWTLAVLAAVVLVKEWLFRRVRAAGADVESAAVTADAWHHRSDAITSAAAFLGISVAVVGTRLDGGPQWAAADDWAALVASAVILYNGFNLLRPAVADLMDRTPSDEILRAVVRAAEATPGVSATEKLKARRVGVGYFVDLHVQADPEMSLHDAHELSHRVKEAIRDAVPAVVDALIHMEPYRGDDAAPGRAAGLSSPASSSSAGSP